MMRSGYCKHEMMSSGRFRSGVMDSDWFYARVMGLSRILDEMMSSGRFRSGVMDSDWFYARMMGFGQVTGRKIRSRQLLAGSIIILFKVICSKQKSLLLWLS